MSLPSRSPPSLLPTRGRSESPIDHEALARMTSSAPHLELLDLNEVLAAYRRALGDQEEDLPGESEPDHFSGWRSATPIPYTTNFTDNENSPGGPVVEFPVYRHRAACLLQINLRLCCSENLSDILADKPEEVSRISRQLAVYTYQALSFLEAMGERHDMIIHVYARAAFIRDLFAPSSTVDFLKQTDCIVNACYQLARGSDDISQVLTASGVDTVEQLQWAIARTALRTVSTLEQRGLSPEGLHNAMAYHWMGFDRQEALDRARQIEHVRLGLDDLLPGGHARSS